MGEKTVPKRTYVDAFRIVSWKVLVLQSRISNLKTIYDSCPSYCGLQNKRVESFCDGCPIIKEDENFRRDTVKELNSQLGDDWKIWSFETLQSAVNDIQQLEKYDSQERLVVTDLLVKIFQMERTKLERSKDEQENAELEEMLKKGLKA